jgi:hypothetical protein
LLVLWISLQHSHGNKELDKFFHNIHCPLYRRIISSFKCNYVLYIVLLDLLLVCLVSKPHHVTLCLQEMLVSILLCWRKHLKIDYSFSKLTSLLMKIFLIDLFYNLYDFIVWITPNKGVGYWYSSKLVDYVVLGYVYMSKTSKSSNIPKFDLTAICFIWNHICICLGCASIENVRHNIDKLIPQMFLDFDKVFLCIQIGSCFSIQKCCMVVEFEVENFLWIPCLMQKW